MYNWHFTLTGDRDSPPLLLLHGWMGSCEDYCEVIELLKSHFYCIAIDLPGHGKTQTHDETGYNFIDTARGIIQLLDDLNIEHCAIAGYSFGGRLTLYLALEFSARFDRVILESTSPGLATASDRQARIANDRQIIDRLITGDSIEFVNNWYRQPLFVGIEKHPNFLDLIHRRIATNRPINLAKSLQYAGLGMQPYLGDRLKTATQPILLIAGELDFKFVTIGQNIERECPNIDFKIVPNCSHNIHFQQPQTWLDLCFKSQPQSF
ncbi:2-succinyl-6-hydroxy-2,4-cyclohexadiene-1-carboxylate synthase [Chamaesiphon sp. GL140_3_metabinner_50]|uniref:2-succinyl-6-hydroxy-2, 4-cyclohexadiene-1-carboxylate synthase n=1 Tax=Chamaesiphon sp. GL140_3_metabinner_50 TaxID=2970812 RepID=UPI0025D0CCDA|nr:2-succinyl-6-hydroxy-2,4-cyclohexadiene-1-carboxylate synthase [Chamaesiphon sp. GL140_3_metabinner_50]